MGPNPPKPNKHKNTKALKVYHENVDELSLAFLLAQIYRKFNSVWATHRCHNVMASVVKLAGSRKTCSILNKILPPLLLFLTSNLRTFYPRSYFWLNPSHPRTCVTGSEERGGGEVLISITSLLWSRGNMMFSYTATVYAQNTKYPARVIESKYDEHPLYVP